MEAELDCVDAASRDADADAVPPACLARGCCCRVAGRANKRCEHAGRSKWDTAAFRSGLGDSPAERDEGAGAGVCRRRREKMRLRSVLRRGGWRRDDGGEYRCCEYTFHSASYSPRCRHGVVIRNVFVSSRKRVVPVFVSIASVRAASVSRALEIHVWSVVQFAGMPMQTAVWWTVSRAWMNG